MQNRFNKIISQTIWLSYLALAIITPLLFSTKNSELFEVPKMHFVYFLAAIILSSTLAKFVIEKKITIPKSWPLLTLFIFIAIQTLSTFTSLDKFTSVFGYPSRLNGGLLSQFAYLAIFAGALINLKIKDAHNLLVALVTSALAVALWGIPGHFGFDPSCLVLTGKLDAACWQKEFDPQLRIFSTLGQPNWLASYLVLLIPISLVLALSSAQKLRTLFFAISTILFVALIFTTSRAGFIGLVAAVFLFVILLGTKFYKKNFKFFALVLLVFLIVSAFFGKALMLRISQFISPRTAQAQGTESGQIRFIVWQGALAAFKNKPALGYGPETFAYSYYLFRPLAHNNTTEWNFFYNKAHNEFLNYLVNTGIIGLIGYLLFLTIALTFLLKRTKSVSESINNKAIFASIIGYQITIFFGFSTTATQLVMYLLLAIGLIQNASQSQELHLPRLEKSSQYFLLGLLTLASLILLSYPIRFYFADLFYARAKNTETLTSFSNALSTFPAKNPFYLVDFAAESATYAQDENQQTLAKKADILAQKAENISPNNLIIERRIATTYLIIEAFDQSYKEKALFAAKKLIDLAPTDPQSYLSQAKVQIATDNKLDAKKTLETALKLKPDYEEARELLGQLQ